jgi:hypothetical protein
VDAEFDTVKTDFLDLLVVFEGLGQFEGTHLGDFVVTEEF